MDEDTAFTKNQTKKGWKLIQDYIYFPDNIIGKGTYGTVHVGTRISDCLPIAVKVIDKRIFNSPQDISFFLSQFHIMKKIEHQNIVQFLNALQTQNNLYFVYELCQGGDLERLIKSKIIVGQNIAIKMLRDIISGYKYLYENGIIHRDLKPANILLKNGNCKIGDFGFAKNLQDGENTLMRPAMGSGPYTSPQIYKEEPYTNKSDLWSVGVIFYQLIFGYTPSFFHFQNPTLSNILNSSEISSSSKDFIERCLKMQECERMSWEEAFSHPLLHFHQPFFENSGILMGNTQNAKNKDNICDLIKVKIHSHCKALSLQVKQKSQTYAHQIYNIQIPQFKMALVPPSEYQILPKNTPISYQHRFNRSFPPS